MNRRGFFRVFAALPIVGVAALAKSVKPADEPDHILNGKVLVRGTLEVEGVDSGAALYAGDGKPPRGIAFYAVGPLKK